MKVAFENLELRDDQSYWHDGKPFNGIAIYRRDNGTVESEIAFVDGVQTGAIKDFHLNGHLACEGNIENGVNHGEFRHWHSDGSLCLLETFEFGICTSRKKLDANSNVLSEYRISANDPNHSLLTAYRKKSKS